MEGQNEHANRRSAYTGTGSKLIPQAAHLSLGNIGFRAWFRCASKTLDQDAKQYEGIRMSCRELRRLVVEINGLPKSEHKRIVRNAIQHGTGNWNIEDPHNSEKFPALIEISLHGIWCVGLSLDEAVENWRRIATKTVANIPAIANAAG